VPGLYHESYRQDDPAVTGRRERGQKKNIALLKELLHELAIIPTSGKNEVFCHEFKCENGDGSRYIVYVNAETGAQENILILIESQSGTLTI
jgi:hypothetical protein